MVKILKISQDKNKYNVVTSLGEYTFNEEVIVHFFIVKGKEFSSTEFDEILDFNDQNEYYLKALNYLSFKERTEFEMKEYLLKKGMQSPDAVIKRLYDKNLLNDSVYAEHFLEYTINNKKGPKYFESELIKRRVKQTIIEEILRKYTFDLQYDTIHQLFLKSVKPKAISYNKYKKQLMDKFVRSGFSLSLINEVIQNNNDILLENIDEDAALKKEFEKIKGLPKQKIYNRLMQRGFHYSKIKELVNKKVD